MHKLLLWTAATALLVAIPRASAADLVGSGSIQDWSGFYLGATAGYGWANADGVFDSSEIKNGFPEEATYADDLDLNGIVGGVHAGYNWQIDNFVLGIEGDVGLTGLSDTVADKGKNDLIAFDLDGLASLRLRAGVAADSLLIYVTGGVAYAFGEFKVTDDKGLAGENTGSVDIDALGGVVGLGAEWALTENVTARLEGLYYFFDDDKGTRSLTKDSDKGDSLGLDNVGVVRAGLSFRL